MIDVYDEIDESIEKEPSCIRIAERYLRGFSRHRADNGTSLMPQDARWVKGVRKLYNRLPDADKAIIDGYGASNASECENYKGREKRLKYLSLLLLIEVGLESRYTIVFPPTECGQ